MAATDCVRLLEQGTVENWELAGAPAQKLGAWWSSLEQLAASDALRVERYWNTEYQVPYVSIVRPDGAPYPAGTTRTAEMNRFERQQRMFEDWGDLLIDAQVRYGLQPQVEPKPR